MESLVGVDCDPTAHAIAGARLRTAAGAATAASESPRAERMGIHQLRGNYWYVCHNVTVVVLL
jgi:hypothetical protein